MSDSRLNVYLQEPERLALKSAAKAINASEAYIVRMLIRKYLKAEYEAVLKRINEV